MMEHQTEKKEKNNINIWTTNGLEFSQIPDHRFRSSENNKLEKCEQNKTKNYSWMYLFKVKKQKTTLHFLTLLSHSLWFWCPLSHLHPFAIHCSFHIFTKTFSFFFFNLYVGLLKWLTFQLWFFSFLSILTNFLFTEDL